MDWLSKLDPNVIAAVVTALGSLVIWIYHRAKGDKVDTIQTMLESVVGSLAHDLLADTKTIPEAQVWLETKLWDTLTVHGIKKTDQTQLLVTTAVNTGIGQLKSLINAQSMVNRAVANKPPMAQS